MRNSKPGTKGKLALQAETIRQLATMELRRAHGGLPRMTENNDDDACITPGPSCTGCPSDRGFSCFASCWAGGCTIVTNKG